ncbi:hypothetical protein BDA99DRAFT_538293 [Phascolomyces articulosus]|uniref:F-box domain-containing protein n=1 Tax=Phascolomyces articulosus TaxID=60185 RepID=A0AAD5JYR0_9FUNG|nr:hypothetical protein BDA99DRAFT_538293 [Phascolomyces articulosus]
MPFFKKVRTAIPPASSSSTQNLLSSSTASSPNRRNENNSANNANVVILRHKKSSKNAQEIFTSSGVSIKEDRDNSPAVSITSIQEIKHMPSAIVSSPYTLPQKEMYKTKLSEKNAQPSSPGGFFHLLPYDILPVIFKKLKYTDLLCCTAVCRQWLNFMLEWPGFWEKMSVEIPNINKATLIALLTHKKHELCFEGLTDVQYMNDVFSFLCSVERTNFDKCYISIKNMDLSTATVRLLGDVIRRIPSSLEKLDLIHCKMTRQDVFDYIFPVCSSNLTHVSFTVYKKYGFYSAFKPNIVITLQWIPTRQRYSLLSPPSPLQPVHHQKAYSALTYLKLTGVPHEDRYYGHTRIRRYSILNLNIPVATFFSQCSNLVYLFLDAQTTLHQYYEACYHYAIELCPHLRTLVVSNDASVPQTMVVKNIDDTYTIDENNVVLVESDSSTTTSVITTPSPSSSSNNDIESAVTNYKGKNIADRLINTIRTTTKNVTVRKTAKSPITTGSLRHFILTGRNKSKDDIHVIPVFKKHHASLELLYLDFDGLGVTPVALNKLVFYGGCPQLREFRLSSLNCSRYDNSKERSSVIISEDLFIQLFSVCPALEAIQIVDGAPLGYTRFLDVTTLVLETIAQKCPRLSQLYISDHPNFPKYRGQYPKCDAGAQCPEKGYSSKDFFCFVNNTSSITPSTASIVHNNKDDKTTEKGKKSTVGDESHHNNTMLESLTVHEMDLRIALTLVKSLYSLKHLHILRWSTINNLDREGELIEPIKNILEGRKGSLLLS